MKIKLNAMIRDGCSKIDYELETRFKIKKNKKTPVNL